MNKGTIFMINHREFLKDPEEFISTLVEEMLHHEPEIKFVDNGIGHYECHGQVGYDTRIEPEIDDYPPVFVDISCWKEHVEEIRKVFKEFMRYSTEFITERENVPCEITFQETVCKELPTNWGYAVQYKLYWDVE